MKPNDKALDKALSVTQIPEENMREYMRRVLTAAYAAQFQSDAPNALKKAWICYRLCEGGGAYDGPFFVKYEPEEGDYDKIEPILYYDAAQFQNNDYAEYVKRLRGHALRHTELGEDPSNRIDWKAADALEAALAELKAQKEYNEVLTCKKLGDEARSAERYWEARWRDELDDNYKLLTQLHEWMCRQEETASTLKRIEVERDALAARLQTAADCLEKLAGDMRPPNNITPQLFMLANSMKQNAQQAYRNARLAPVEAIESDKDDPTREYIPLPGGWEIQTKGKGSSYRLLDTKTGERHMILAGDAPFVQEFVTRMAKEINAIAQVRPVAPVDDEALVEIAVRTIHKEAEKGPIFGGNLIPAVIAAIRPHIEAAERERSSEFLGLFLELLGALKKVVATHHQCINLTPETIFKFEDLASQAEEIAKAIRRGK